MNFLKKFGQVVANIAGIVAGIGPIFQKALPSESGVIGTVTSDFEQVAGIVGMIEAAFTAVGNAKGTDKLKAATPLVVQAILASTLMVGKKIADPVAFNTACTEITSGFADLLNSLHGDSVKVESLPK